MAWTRARVPRRRSRVLLALFLLALLAVALEVVVRAAGLVDLSRGAATEHQAAFNDADLFIAVGDADLSYANRPLASATIDGIEYRHDEHGWRVTPGLAPAETGATSPARVVAFLGDSTTYGLGLAAQDALPAQVAAALAATTAAGPGGIAIRALNLGVCGYATGQEAALYESQRAALADVDIVVLVFFPNDFAAGTFLWDSGLRIMYVDPLPLPFALKGWLWRSALYRAVVSRLGSSDAVRLAFDAANPANRRLALEQVARLAALVAADGKRLLVAHLPAMEALDPYQFVEPVAALAQTCARLGVPYVDLLPAFLAERERQVAAWAARGGAPVSAEHRRNFLAQYWISAPRDHHLDAAATSLAAPALAEALAPLLGTH
ncbi:MAG TPA: GDSL-type esterase/lipase family protein [Planctomycetota bacterium]|nr:GDSL-type esterase/lipase family protein [Planctomycetota bacterium]